MQIFQIYTLSVLSRKGGRRSRELNEVGQDDKVEVVIATYP